MRQNIVTKACTVIIPTKNRPMSIKCAVRSALNALPENSEIIVIDDGSDEGVSGILQDLCNDNLSVFVNSPPHGPAQARNLGLNLAKGKTVFFLDDDDELLPHYLKYVVERRSKLPQNCVYGFSPALKKTVNGLQLLNSKSRLGHVNDENQSLSQRLAGFGMGFWVDRTTILSLGGIDENLKVNEDTEFCIRLASRGYTCFCSASPGVVLNDDELRNLNDQKSITNSASAITRAAGLEYILTKHISFLDKHPRVRLIYILRILKYRWRSRSLKKWADFVKMHQLGWLVNVIRLFVLLVLTFRQMLKK